MSYCSANGNLAIMYAHSFTQYSIIIRPAHKKSNYQGADDGVSNPKHFEAVTYISLIKVLNQMQVWWFHKHDALTSVYASPQYSLQFSFQ